jgi:TolB-like protein/tetratricopeptide (TPR) repeat protein
MALLRLLVENAGRIVDRDAIMDAVWPGVTVTDESITQCVRDVRKALGDETQRLLKTVPKRGYLLAVEVAPTEAYVTTPRGERRLLVAVAALFAVLFVGGVWWFWPVEPSAGKPAIAVLPFENLGGDEATGRLAGGLTEDIITDLARFREIDVIARNSTEVYEGKDVDVREVGRALDVGYVLEGSIQRQADRVRITAQLIQADTGTHVWSERWDRPIEDVFAVQSEVADAVAGRLGGHGVIAAAQRDLIRRKPPADLTAYDLYLLGIEQKHRLTKESLAEAIRLLRQAVERDPQLSRAWTGLTWAYTISAGYAASPEEGGRLLEQALEAASRAVQTDPADAEAHDALGEALAYSGDLARARAEIETALALNPVGTMPLFIYSGWASGFGEPDKGAEAADRLLRLDPNIRSITPGGLSYPYFMVGRYQDALNELTAKAEDRLDRVFSAFKAGALAMLDRGDEARAVVARTLGRFPDWTIEGFVNRPEWADHERKRLVETMRKAGFPACASAQDLAKLAKPIRLPECEAERTGVAAAKAR